MLGRRLLFSAIILTSSLLKECCADRVLHDGAEIITNSKRMNATEWYVYKYNKTEAALAVTFYIPNERALWNYTVHVDGYQRMGMEWIYKKSALSVAFPFCTWITGALSNMKHFRAFGKMIEKCGEAEGPRTYSVRDLIWDDRVPLPLLPGNYWRVDQKYQSNYDNDLLYLQYFFHIDRSNRRKMKIFNLPGK